MQDPSNPFAPRDPIKAPKAKPETKQHFYLIAGEVSFSVGDEIGTMRLNGVLQTQDLKLTTTEIGLSQQILQKHFFGRIGDPEAKVHDVFIYGFTHMGFMFNSEFTKHADATASGVALN